MDSILLKIILDGQNKTMKDNMNAEKIDLENLSQDDFLEMAKYVAHVENQNRVLLDQLKECKAAVLATVQQRNS